ncbi:MAG: helix-turn-helix transcriptional regulator, partial [Chlamydiia bacterium]|nr:helix-turn-helix transcriptional regulator [Chlamydiia bacterium]
MSKKNLTLTQRRIIDKLSTLLSVDENIGIAEVIRLLRKRFCMTQKQLAKRAGMPQSYISKIESGELEPTLKTIKKIFEVFSSDVIILPIARSSFDDVIKKQAV